MSPNEVTESGRRWLKQSSRQIAVAVHNPPQYDVLAHDFVKEHMLVVKGRKTTKKRQFRRRGSAKPARGPSRGCWPIRRVVKLFLPIFKMNFPEIVDIALPAEGVFHNLVFVSIKKTYPMQAYKIMHGLWGMGQMMFTKYIVVVDADVDVHNTSEVLFRLCANTDPQRDSIFTKGPADVLDHATSEIAIGTKLGIDATRKLPGEGHKRGWPPLIQMDEATRKKIDTLFGGTR